MTNNDFHLNCSDCLGS